MEGPVGSSGQSAGVKAAPAVTAPNEAGARAKSPHLMCGTAFWGLAGAVASAYFCYRSYWHIANGAYSWPHTWWTVVTYGVWVTVTVGALTETRCTRERIFFGLVALAFLFGFAFSAWAGVPEGWLRQLRMASTALWGLAAVASLATSLAPRPQSREGT